MDLNLASTTRKIVLVRSPNAQKSQTCYRRFHERQISIRISFLRKHLIFIKIDCFLK